MLYRNIFNKNFGSKFSTIFDWFLYRYIFQVKTSLQSFGGMTVEKEFNISYTLNYISINILIFWPNIQKLKKCSDKELDRSKLVHDTQRHRYNNFGSKKHPFPFATLQKVTLEVSEK